MEWFWTWGGECFGYRDGDNLRTYDGKHIGKFYYDEVYDRNGNYLGEIRNSNRLITKNNKKNNKKRQFTPYSKRGGYSKRSGYTGYTMYLGYDDFPSPDSFDDY